MNLKPIGKRVVVKDIPMPPQSKGGILIPETVRNPSQEKTVVELGTAESFDVKVGDRVIVGQYQGIPLEIDGKKLMIVSEDVILCIMDHEDEPATT